MHNNNWVARDAWICSAFYQVCPICFSGTDFIFIYPALLCLCNLFIFSILLAWGRIALHSIAKIGAIIAVLLLPKIRCSRNSAIIFAVKTFSFTKTYFPFNILPEKYENRNCCPKGLWYVILSMLNGAIYIYFYFCNRRISHSLSRLMWILQRHLLLQRGNMYQAF